MKKTRMIVNLAMTLTLLCLMAYSLVGETLHEVLGILLFALFAVHHILNRRWFGALGKGRWNAFRVVQTALVFALACSVIAQVVSGIALSKHLFTFLPPFANAAKARETHLVCAYLSFLLMSLHLGLHWNAMLSAVTRGKTVNPWILRIPAFLVAGYGVYAFVRRQIGEYLFLRTPFVFFDYDEPLIFFFLDYLAVMALFVFLGHYLAKAAKRLPRRETKSGDQ